MANKVPIEEQVAQLSQYQQDKIVRVGKIASVLQLVGGIPWLVFSVLGLWTLINPPLGFDYNDLDKVYKGLMIWLLIGAIYIVGISVFVKIKYPYYSDAKCRYIIKIRKQNIS